MEGSAAQEGKGFFVFLNLFRWLNWLLALVLLYLRATPEVPAAVTIGAYGSVFILNGIFTFWPHNIESALKRRPQLILFDWLFCAALVYAYGWGSPFYVYSFSPVMLAGYLFGLRGAFAMAVAGAAGYLASVSLSGHNWQEIVDRGEIDTHLFQVFDYLLVAVFFSYPVILAEKLRVANRELVWTQGKITRLVLAKERQRMAQDIHDNVTQSLLGVNLLLDEFLEKNQDDPRLTNQLSLAKEAAATAMVEMREAVDDLFTDRLDRLTVREIIEQALEKARQTHGLKATLDFTGREPGLALEIKKALYLIIQECVSNAIKHAHANSIEVDLIFDPKELRVAVTDDGCGFQKKSEASGNGFKTIGERLAALRGTCRISSQPDLGTKIEVMIPLTLETMSSERTN